MIVFTMYVLGNSRTSAEAIRKRGKIITEHAVGCKAKIERWVEVESLEEPRGYSGIVAGSGFDDEEAGAEGIERVVQNFSGSSYRYFRLV